MMMNKKVWVGSLLVATSFALAACGNGNNEMNHEENGEEMNMEESESHEGMNHSSSGEVPEDLAVAQNPKFEVGDEITLTTDHMNGMNGAEATIVGAYDTTAYSVTYTPTTGGEPVENHKWVIHEEIADAGEAPIEPGTEVTLQASHMKGMEGATATIESAKQTTVYMVDYMPTTGGEKVTNHKWVTGSELKPVDE